jgi:Ca2+-binding EF-hand superfamily protein
MKASRLLIAGAVAAFAPFAGAIAQSPPPSDPPSQPAQEPQQRGTTFESLDTDSDGRISKTEASANANVSAQFSKYDQNGDGFIERDEVTSANHASSETPKQ